MPSSLDLIRTEHRNIARVLRALEDIAKDTANLSHAARSDLLTSILYYLRVFPYAVHHPKEERHLFPAVAAKDKAAGVAAASLHTEHAEGYGLLHKIESLAAAATDEKSLGILKSAILSYVEHERRHMAREEQEILPAAERVLSESEQTAIRQAFAGHADPMFGENIQTGFDVLHRLIQDKSSRN